MAESPPNARSTTGRLFRFSYSLSTLFLLTVAIALAFGWWSAQTREASGKSTYDVEGPLDVAYTVREASNRTAGSNGVVALGIDFEEDYVVIHTERGGIVLSSNVLINFFWTRKVQQSN